MAEIKKIELRPIVKPNIKYNLSLATETPDRQHGYNEQKIVSVLQSREGESGSEYFKRRIKLIQLGSEFRTCLDFVWSIRGWFANGLDFKWDLESRSLTI